MASTSNLPSSPADAIGFHDQLAVSWSDNYKKPSFVRRYDAFAELLQSQELTGQQWLDAGCGTGNLSRLLLDRNAHVHGVDGSAQMIEQSKRLNCNRANASFQQIPSLIDWTWQGEPFQGILCSSVLEYIDSPSKLVEQFSNMLLPDGILLISVPNRFSAIRVSQKLTHWMTSKFCKRPFPSYLDHSRTDFSVARITNLLESNSFRVELIKNFGIPAARFIPESRWLSPLLLIRARYCRK
jgi:2-polyprenyl-3-methyl-5-hydroxy-6-metoxy-1,4-benzoquinol methylase